MTLLALGACANMTRSERNVGAGALSGAALGGILGSFTGDLGWGALSGTGVDAGAGYLYEQSERSQDRSYRRGVQDGSQHRSGR